MPNYRGLNVLRYECRLLDALNIADKEEIALLEDESFFPQRESAQAHIDLINSFMASRKERQARYNSAFEEFNKLYVPTDDAISWDPLEFLYQENLPHYLPYLLREIEKRYDMRCDTLMSNGIVSLRRSAAKIATFDLYHNLVGSIIHEYLINEQLRELYELPATLRNSFYNSAVQAIQEKYNYFADRLQNCVEIGNKIRELSR